MVLSPLFRLMSPPGPGAKLSVLIFHRVLPQPDDLFPDEMHADRFAAVCAWLASWFNVLPLDQAVGMLRQGTLPARAACITFDDGYADNHRVAMPILQSHGLSATFFIATGFLDGGRMWNDTLIEAVRSCKTAVLDLDAMGLGRHGVGNTLEKRAAVHSLISQIKYRPVLERVAASAQVAALAGVRLPDDLMMASDDVRAMRKAGMQIGAHTESHPILATLSDDNALQEIAASKARLEDLLGERVGLFAYPNGKPGEDYTPRTVELARSLGFDAAVSTQWGFTSAGDDLFQIRRFTPWDTTRLRFAARLLANLRSGARPTKAA